MNTDNRAMPVFLSIGFRPFFLGAGLFALLSITQWAMVYLFGLQLDTAPISVWQWHAHEMIYGYAMAVIAGFLLTAVANWTGLTTATGTSLLTMFSCWSVARLLYLFGSQFALAAGVFDLLFQLLLLVAIARPIIKQRMWIRMAVVSKVALLMVFNSLYLLATTQVFIDGAYLAIYGGLYLVIGIILTVGKNLIPFFIQRGVGYEVKISSFRWLDFASLALFLIFFILELARVNSVLSGYLAIGVLLVNAVRLGQWHTPGIWRKPLLWGLYISYCFICLGFLLMALHYFAGIAKFIAIHAFAVGGVGLITLSMMSRVAWGHTGRVIATPPPVIKVAFLLLILCVIARVIMPLLLPELTVLWMQTAFVLWLAAFAVFIGIYAPILLRPRVDAS